MQARQLKDPLAYVEQVTAALSKWPLLYANIGFKRHLLMIQVYVYRTSHGRNDGDVIDQRWNMYSSVSVTESFHS